MFINETVPSSFYQWYDFQMWKPQVNKYDNAAQNIFLFKESLSQTSSFVQTTQGRKTSWNIFQVNAGTLFLCLMRYSVYVA